MYDETIQRIVKKKKITPIKIDMIYLEEIVRNFQSENPLNIILTGTAGDGKTFYCREVWNRLGGSESIWNEDLKIKELKLNDKKLKFIKDLSELSDEEKEILSIMA